MQDSLSHKPPSKWQFDEEVTRCFDDMLLRSIPNYEQAQTLMAKLTVKALEQMSGGTVLDLGVSLANSFKLIEHYAKNKPSLFVNYVGLDNSEPMVKSAKEQFTNARYFHANVQDFMKFYKDPIGVAILSLTLQFIPVEHRQELLSQIFQRLKKGGCVFLFEKCLGADSTEEDLFTEMYYDFKQSNGYTMDSILAKRKSLENVLVPLDQTRNREMLEREGFRVHLLSHWCNFSLMVGYKDTE